MSCVLNLPIISAVTDVVEGTVTQKIEIGCDAGAVVNDLVRLSLTVDNFVDVAIDNTDNRPIIGIIDEKISPTVASVILRGVITQPDPLGVGKAFLGTDGKFTITGEANFPTSDYQQVLGYSFGTTNGKIHFEPNAIHKKLI